MKSVYITEIAKFLPNAPVDNEQMENILGEVGGKPSKARKIVLRNNGIKSRYYAFRDGKATHTNAQMVAEAVRSLFKKRGSLKELQLLACGTTSADQLIPSHAAMVHGELGIRPIEIVSTTSACNAGIQALKYAAMSVMTGNCEVAVATGSDRLSVYMKRDMFEAEAEKLIALHENPYIAFEKDFLRWMLSDGAGAFLLENKPKPEGISLKIEWIEMTSYANQVEPCMYVGAQKNEDGTLTGWLDQTEKEWLDNSTFSFKQDTKLLSEKIVPLGVQYYIECMKKHNIKPDELDWFLPHLSSEFFKQKVKDGIEKENYDIPYEKWFTNLTTTGNIGAGSPFIILEEIYNSGKLKTGQKILMMIPESARFSYAYILLTVV